MWIFGYGSLMWDGWERQHAAKRQVTAILSGYRRVFNKKSVRNWGTVDSPGPTLNIERSEGAVCTGVAFEFDDARRDLLLAYLKKREGRGFVLREMSASVPDEPHIVAIVPVYEGPNIVSSAAIYELVAQVCAAQGTSGACVDYVRGVARELKCVSAPKSGPRAGHLQRVDSTLEFGASRGVPIGADRDPSERATSQMLSAYCDRRGGGPFSISNDNTAFAGKYEAAQPAANAEIAVRHRAAIVRSDCRIHNNQCAINSIGTPP